MTRILINPGYLWAATVQLWYGSKLCTRVSARVSVSCLAELMTMSGQAGLWSCMHDLPCLTCCCPKYAINEVESRNVALPSCFRHSRAMYQGHVTPASTGVGKFWTLRKQKQLLQPTEVCKYQGSGLTCFFGRSTLS